MPRVSKKPAARKPAAKKPVDAVKPGLPIVLPPARMNEIEILKSRGKSHPGNPIQIRADVQSLIAVLAKTSQREGEDAHEIGTEVATLYHSFAERVYGYHSFVAFAKAELHLSRSTMYRYLIVARYANAVQARWGVETCAAAGRLIELLRGRADLRRRFRLKADLRTITDIARINFPVADGRTVQLKGERLDAAVVEEVIASLSNEPSGRAGEKRLPRPLRDANKQLKLGTLENPAMESVLAHYVIRKGKPVFELIAPASSDLEAAALAVIEILQRGR